MPILYSIRQTATGYLVAKFDNDFNVAGVYNLAVDGKSVACDCPAGVRPSCRHRHMLQTFALAGAIDTDRFYCYETQTWHQPIPTYDEGEPSAALAVDAAKAPLPAGPTPPTNPSPRLRRLRS